MAFRAKTAHITLRPELTKAVQEKSATNTGAGTHTVDPNPLNPITYITGDAFTWA